MILDFSLFQYHSNAGFSCKTPGEAGWRGLCVRTGSDNAICLLKAVRIQISVQLIQCLHSPLLET